MERIQADSNNVFVGANVFFKNEEHIVVKVNDKSCYLSKNKSFIDIWEKRPKGMKWKPFCERYEGFMTLYSGITISPDEKEKKVEVEKKAKRAKKFRPVSAHGEKTLVTLFSEIEKKYKGKHYRGYKTPFQDGSNYVNIVAENHELRKLLVHVTGTGVNNYYFFDLNEADYSPFIKDEHKSGKEILWK